MTNGVLDIQLILFRLGQYILVLFVGYCSVRGFISLMEDIQNNRILNIKEDTEYYHKKLELQKAKDELKDYKENRKNSNRIEFVSGFFVEEPEKDDKPSETCTDELEERKEVTEEIDIPTLDEVLKEDPNFLQHSENYKTPLNDSYLNKDSGPNNITKHQSDVMKKKHHLRKYISLFGSHTLNNHKSKEKFK